MGPEEFVKRARRLPAPPNLVTRLMTLVKDPNVDVDQVAELFRQNPSLTAKLLKLANSAFYGLRGEVSRVHHALVLLGFKTVRSLVVTVWTHSVASENTHPEASQFLRGIFVHGVATAVVAHELCERKLPKQAEDAFLAGLLHDIGRLALACELGTLYDDKLLKVADAEKFDTLELEHDVLGFNHSDLGALLMKQWALPSVLADAAALHHEADISFNEQPVLASVAVADSLVTELEYNVALQSVRPNRSPLFSSFGLADDEKRASFLEHCRERVLELLHSVD